MSVTSSPKKEQILKTGKELFWKYGFKLVTIEEICKEAGVSKMTYYKYFTNKITITFSASTLHHYRLNPGNSVLIFR